HRREPYRTGYDLRMILNLLCRAFINDKIHDGISVVIAGEQIISVSEGEQKYVETICVDGVIVPGFIDMHVHGGDGADFMDASEEAAARVASFHARQGTTAMAATTLSGSTEAIRDAVGAIARVARLRPDTAAEICGVHLE